jgi:hypothetical protein
VRRLRAEGTVVQIPVEAEAFFLFSENRLDQLSRAFSFLLGRHRSSSPTVKRPGRDIYHSPTYTAKVKNAWSCTATPLICLHGVVTNNFTLFNSYPANVENRVSS